MKSFRDVIALWRTPDELASELGISIFAARHWKTRDRIPPEYWLSIIQAAEARGHAVKVDDLARVAARELEAA